MNQNAYSKIDYLSSHSLTGKDSGNKTFREKKITVWENVCAENKSQKLDAQGKRWNYG